MHSKFFAFLFTTLFVLSGTATAQICGMQHVHQNRIKAAANPKGVAAKFVYYRWNQEYCEPEAYYDSVYTRETKHFQIFYTLGEGPHATRPELIDSLAVALEDAYDFHTKTMDMRAPMGLDTTSHYQMPVKKGFYPIEVADINFIRDPKRVLGSDTDMCRCFGVTYPDTIDHNKSAILIDNDFRYTTKFSTQENTIEKNGETCYYPGATETLNNSFNGYSYANEWAKAIRMTAFHELFHGVQLRYMDLLKHWTYWIEGSAAANEEIGAPDINDYIGYIPNFFSEMYSRSFDNIEISDYGTSALYLYLYKNVDKHFDKEIWENFEKSPNKPFVENLEKVLDKRDISADSIFHDFATRLVFSGEKSKAIDKKLLVWEDQPLWPSPMIRPGNSSYTDSKNDFLYYSKEFSDDNRFEPDTTLYSFRYYAGGEPDLENYKGRASVLLFKGGKAEIRRLANTGTIDTVNKESFSADSIIWVFSRYSTPKRIPEVIKDSTLRAFPVPWRGTGPLCFTPLPDTKNFIEIRSGRGELVLREPYDRTTHCIDGDYIKSKLKPGVYRFRAGASGKLQKFLVVY